MAPAMVKLGYPQLVVHMFILYYAVISMVTPPVAISAYAAAGIANADINRTGWYAFLLCAPGFVVPILTLFYPSLILHDSFLEMAAVLIPIVGGMAAIVYFAPKLLGRGAMKSSDSEKHRGGERDSG